ncbi:MAG: asparagine--tRNA ligase [Desulfosalsimonadaceae bacterium]|nr:asparagine--tRNA ligase [Desulfosalsimonadaceae bacterium]
MKRNRIITLLSSDQAIGTVLIKGWVKTRRDAKDFSFIEVNDGSCLQNIQVVADQGLTNFDAVKKLSTGSAVAVDGTMRPSPGKGQKWEIHATSVDIISIAPDEYPLQKKRHTDEFLRTISHLRPRTNKYGAAFRIRSKLSYAIHRFFQERGFAYIHTPILTGSDSEGAGELFQVTAMDFENPPRSDGKIDYNQDFFNRPANLTVSGQLEAEMFALALGDVYTFGPTFRAENSNTSRHAAEFWMVEPEMAFSDLNDDMDLAETFVRYLVTSALENCREDLGLFAEFVDKTLMDTLETVSAKAFIRLPYAEAVAILNQSGHRFNFDVSFGTDLQTEHERYLAEIHFKQPVIIYNYPRTIKPFYMRVNDDGRTVAAMDVIVPRIGEIIGGSQREERLDVLEGRMAETAVPQKDLWWYLDSRRFGSVPHSGFGLGFERLIMLVTGISNIRDVIPFPRTPGNIEF